MDVPDFTGAVCARHPNPDLWTEENAEDQAIALCRTGGPGGQPCPVLTACLIYATDPEADVFTRVGIWGGLNAMQRSRIRARRLRHGGADVKVSVPTHRSAGRNRRYQTVTFTAPNRQTPMQESSL